MSASLVARWKGHAVFGALFSLTIKVGGSVSALAMFALAAQTLDVAAFGRLVIVFNIVSLAAVAAVFGQDTLIQRSWGEYVATDPGSARGAMIFGAVVALLGATVATLAFALWAMLDGRLTPAETVAVAAFLATQTLLHFTANLGRIVRGARWSEPPRELFWRLPLVVGLGAAAALGGHASIVAFFTVAAIAQALGLAYLAFVIAAGLPAPIRAARPQFRLGEWSRRSTVMTSAAIAEAAHQYADVILIGHVLGSTAAGAYFVVLRIANIFSMLTSGIHTYSASKVSHLYYMGKIDDLRRLMAQIMALTLLLVGLFFAVIVVEGSFLLSIFGGRYCEYHRELVMMSGVTAFAALAGPGPMLMLTMGADLRYLQLVVAALGARIVGLLVLAPAFGLVGAILAAAVAVVPLVVAVTTLCIRRLGVDPSILALPRHLTFGARRPPGGEGAS
jgi:O-antigen/teichoic acid export membrane protein